MVDRRFDLATQLMVSPPFDRLLPLPPLDFEADVDHGGVGYPPSPRMPASAADSLRRAPETAAMVAVDGLVFVVVVRT